MPLSEHGYCLAVTFKVTEQIEILICIKFCVKLEHSSMETIQIIQKATAGDWQLHPENAPAHASHLMQSFLMKIQTPQVTNPSTAQIWHPVTSGFSQN